VRSYVKTFEYDDLDRMIMGDNKAYEYDAIGNITNADGTPYSYDLTHIHALAYDGVNQYIYDANGNIISGAGRTITYDPENRPITITSGTAKVDFVYDGDGNRVKKSIRNGLTTIYIGGFYEKNI
jgi:YD repeat-containing protein